MGSPKALTYLTRRETADSAGETQNGRSFPRLDWTRSDASATRCAEAGIHSSASSYPATFPLTSEVTWSSARVADTIFPIRRWRPNDVAHCWERIEERTELCVWERKRDSKRISSPNHRLRSDSLSPDALETGDSKLLHNWGLRKFPRGKTGHRLYILPTRCLPDTMSSSLCAV